MGKAFNQIQSKKFSDFYGRTGNCQSLKMFMAINDCCILAWSLITCTCSQVFFRSECDCHYISFNQVIFFKRCTNFVGQCVFERIFKRTSTYNDSLFFYFTFISLIQKFETQLFDSPCFVVGILYETCLLRTSVFYILFLRTAAVHFIFRIGDNSNFIGYILTCFKLIWIKVQAQVLSSLISVESRCRATTF